MGMMSFESLKMDIQIKNIFKQFLKILGIGIIFLSESSYGNAHNLYEETQPWKHSYLNKTVKIPHPLVIISDFENIISSPAFKKINRLALAPFLDGRECHSGEKHPYIQSFRVYRILPENTPFELIQAFMIDERFSLLEKFIFKTLSLFEMGVKGGPPLYFVAKDSTDEKFTINELRVINEMFYLYSPSGDSSSSAGKARAILKAFKTRESHLQTISLEIETYQEFFDEKCQFYQSPEDQKKNKQWPQMAFQALSQFVSQQTSYTFKNMELNGKYIKLEVDEASLAFLLLNSSHLSIKNIVLHST